jgi:uncharacterized protein involved in exopolysaccharide biosynthesis
MNSSHYPTPSEPYGAEVFDKGYMDLSDAFRRLRRYFWIPLLLALAGIAGAVWVSATTPPAYESQVRILFPGMAGVGGFSALAASLGVDTNKAQPMDMYAEVLKSTRIVAPIAQKYHLDQYGIRVKEPKDINRIVQVRTNAKAATLTLTAIAPKAPLAPAMAGDLCDALSQFVRDAALSDNKNSTAFLGKRIRDVEARLQRKDEELRNYQESHRIAGASSAASGGSSSGASSTGAALAAKLTDVNAAIQANQARIAEVRRQLELQVDHPERLAEGAGLAQKWRDQLSNKTHLLALAEAQYGPENPQVVLLKKEISDVKAQIAREISGARYAMEQGITPELASLLAERESLTAQRASLSEVLSQIPAQEMKVTQLARESLLLSTLYSTLQQRYQEAQLAEMNDPSRFTFLDTPSLPLQPARPRWKRNLALGGLMGLMLGVFLALLLPEARPTTGTFASPRVEENAIAVAETSGE